MEFSQSTQALHWTFDTESLSLRRETTRAAAVARLQDASELIRSQGATSAANECARGPLSAEDEALLLAHLESKLQDICRTENKRDPTRFTNRVLAAAQMFFKRFYLVEPLVSEDPKFLMLAALYLAAKVEEERITVEDLVERYAKDKLQPEVLLALEMRLLQALRFQVVTRSPFRCLIGLMQALHSNGPSSTVGQEGAVASRDAHLAHLNRAAIAHVCRMLCTDAPLLFSPQLIALASLDAAGREVPAASGIDVRGWIDSIETVDFGGGGAEARPNPAELGRQLAAVEAAAESSAIDLSSGDAEERVKQAHKRLKELLKAARQLHKVREEQRSAAEEAERQKRSRRKEELRKEEQERMVAAVESAAEGASVMHKENLKRRRGADEGASVKVEELSVKREGR